MPFYAVSQTAFLKPLNVDSTVTKTQGFFKELLKRLFMFNDLFEKLETQSVHVELTLLVLRALSVRRKKGTVWRPHNSLPHFD